MTGWIMVGVTPSSINVLHSRKKELDAGAAAPLAEQCLIAPLGDKPRLIVRSGALAHLPHLLGEGVGPGEPPRELARRAGLEQQAVSPRLDQLGSRADAARDHR